jgi:hypothetical protein
LIVKARTVTSRTLIVSQFPRLGLSQSAERIPWLTAASRALTLSGARPGGAAISDLSVSAVDEQLGIKRNAEARQRSVIRGNGSTDDRGHAEAREELAAGQDRRRFEFGL